MDDLKDQLKNTKGKKAREALQKEIDELDRSIKGHEKEIRQKWPTPPEPPKKGCPEKDKGNESGAGSGGKSDGGSGAKDGGQP